MGSPAPLTVVTIGYQGRRVDEFIAELSNRGVELVVDVRENAVSRKPAFSKRRLCEALAAAGIEYQHAPLLGNPRSNRDAFRAGEPSARDVFLRHLDNGSREVFEEVAAAARTKTIALMCFEQDHDSCHRSCITDQMVAERADLRVEPV